MGGKDIIKIFIYESKKYIEEEGVSNIKVILRDLGGFVGEFG